MSAFSASWPRCSAACSQAAFESAQSGLVVTAPGRDGLYIFQIQTRDNNGPNNSPRVEAKEIYLPEKNFETWYQTEALQIKIKKII